MRVDQSCCLYEIRTRGAFVTKHFPRSQPATIRRMFTVLFVVTGGALSALFNVVRHQIGP